jgi:hypothetical protein
MQSSVVFTLWIWFVHSFLKLSKIDISEHWRFLSQIPARLQRSTRENSQGQEGDQKTEQRTRDRKPE